MNNFAIETRVNELDRVLSTAIERVNDLDARVEALEAKRPILRSRWHEDFAWPTEPGDVLSIPTEVANNGQVSKFLSTYHQGEFTTVQQDSFTLVVKLETPRKQRAPGKPRGKSVKKEIH